MVATPANEAPTDGVECWLISDPDGPDVHLDEVERRLREAGHAYVLRVAHVFDIIRAARSLSSSAGPIARLNIIGHGAPGYLRIGSPHHGDETLLDVRSSCFAAWRQLEGALTANAEVRLLGCCVALHGVTGSGPLLQLALSQALNASVHAPRGDVFHTDYGARGFVPENAPPDFLQRVSPADATIETRPARRGRDCPRSPGASLFDHHEVSQIQLRTPLASPMTPRAYGIEPRQTWAVEHAGERVHAFVRAVLFDHQWSVSPLAAPDAWVSIALAGSKHFQAEVLTTQAAIRIFDEHSVPRVFDLDQAQYALFKKGTQ